MTRRNRSIGAAPSQDDADACVELLLEAINCGDPERARRLRGRVAHTYLPVARSIARRYRGRGVDYADLEQLASIGLVKATNRWQPGLCEDFLQFAAPTMIGEIKRYFRDHSFAVRPTRRVQEVRAAVRSAQQDHWQRHGSEPTEQDLAMATGANLPEIREARAAGGLCWPSSIDEPQSDGTTFANSYGELDQRLGHLEDSMTVARMMRHLTERERTIVKLRFELEWSQQRIGAELGVSQMQISRWLKVITSKLHKAATR